MSLSRKVRDKRFGSLCRGVLAMMLFGSVVNLCGQENFALEPSSLNDGEELASLYCAACHQLPEADLLPKQSWEFALTYMGFYLGIVDYDYLEGNSERTMGSIHSREEFTRAANKIPKEPLLSDDQWKALRNHYVFNAPEQAIPQISKAAIIEDTESFRVRPNQYRMDSAVTSMTRIDEENGLLYVHDSGAQRLTILDRKLNFYDSHDAPGVALVDSQMNGEDVYLLSIGDLFAANIGEPRGELQHARSFGGVLMGLKVLVAGLHRPADFAFGDLDQDGVDELLVSNFGEYTGNFSIYRRERSTAFFDPEPQILTDQPGIVKSEAHDFNGDGRLDIVVLMSNARENVSIFINEEDGSFTRKIIVEQHPSFGYTGFELRDFNEDGLMDLLTINGDNGDSDPYNTLKRDHGIRIYLNRGNLKFEESYFYPMYGVFGTKVEDFDLDGDLDVAAIAYHPDFDREKLENFVMLEQTELLKFASKTHPATYNGRWMTIDAGDLDGDGDKDIVLGAAYLPVGIVDRHADKFRKMASEGPPLLFLENRIKP